MGSVSTDRIAIGPLALDDDVGEGGFDLLALGRRGLAVDGDRGVLAPSGDTQIERETQGFGVLMRRATVSPKG